MPELDRTVIAEEGLDSQEQPVSQDQLSFVGEDDPSNPINWSSRYKWSLVGLLALISLAG